MDIDATPIDRVHHPLNGVRTFQPVDGDKPPCTAVAAASNPKIPIESYLQVGVLGLLRDAASGLVDWPFIKPLIHVRNGTVGVVGEIDISVITLWRYTN